MIAHGIDAPVFFRERFSLTDKPKSDGHGIYFIFLKKTSKLQDFSSDGNTAIYIGKSESTIGARNHAKYEISSSSTLRRSLGAILRQSEFPDTKVFPRPSKGKQNKAQANRSIQNYCFSAQSEAFLSRWMKENLEFCYEIVLGSTKEIRQREREYIKSLRPILNLTHSKALESRKLKELRLICRIEARKGLSRNG